MNKSFILIFCCIAIVLLGLMGMTIQHETAHKMYYRYYGVESEMHLRWFGLAGGYTIANVTDLNQMSESDYKTLTMLHSINEIYYYPFYMMYIMISFFFILCLAFFVKSMKEMENLNKQPSNSQV